MIAKILEEIKQAESIIIFRHIRPDGDAIGSQYGLKYILKENFPDKKILCLGENSNYWNMYYSNINSDLVDDETIKDSLAIIIDTPNTARIDDERWKLAKRKIKIDHHIFAEEFADLEWVDTSSIAACQLVVKFALENNLVIPRNAALLLYTGLVTDSGRFQFQNTSGETLRMAAALLDTGIEVQDLYRFMYESYENIVRFKGYCENNFTLLDCGLAYNVLDQEILKEYNVTSGTGASNVNSLSGIKGVKIFVHFAEQEDGLVKVEFRSKKIPVNFIANKYGGGGHALASGTTLESFDLIDKVIDDLIELCEGDEE